MERCGDCDMREEAQTALHTLLRQSVNVCVCVAGGGGSAIK